MPAVFVTVGVPAYLVVYHRAWYVKTRSFIVGVMRIASCLTILAHCYCHPGAAAAAWLRSVMDRCGCVCVAGECKGHCWGLEPLGLPWRFLFACMSRAVLCYGWSLSSAHASLPAKCMAAVLSSSP